MRHDLGITDDTQDIWFEEVMESKEGLDTLNLKDLFLPKSKTWQVPPPLDDSAVSEDPEERLPDIIEDGLNGAVIHILQDIREETLEVNDKHNLVHDGMILSHSEVDR